MLLEVLGPDDHHRIPTLFFPMRLQLHIPLYVQLAIEHQAKRAWDDERVRTQTFLREVFPRGVHDYVSDILHERIEEEMLRAFGHNEAFLRAFHYPFEAGV